MLSNLFRPEGKFFQFGSKAADLIAVSLLWLLCCIPLVTVGPACTAMYNVVVQNIRRGQGGSVWQQFWRIFRRDFRQSLMFMMLATALAAALLISILLLTRSGAHGLGIPVLEAVLLLLVLTLPYAFALISRFENSFPRLLRLTLLLTFRHFPASVLMAAILALGAFLVYLHLPLAALMPGLICLCTSFVTESIFRKYRPASEAASIKSVQ